MFKDAIDQMEDDEYIDKLHRQISGLKNDIEMIDQQNLSIMKTAEKHKRKAERLEQQNKRYRATINAMGQIFKDAIHSLDVGEKVQGLEYGVAMRNEELEGESDD